MTPLSQRGKSRSHLVVSYTPSRAAAEASDYFNALPIEERKKLAPLLEHYRQMGLAECGDVLRAELRRIDNRIRGIRDAVEEQR